MDIVSNPLLKLTKNSLKYICFGCEDCKDNPFEIFCDKKSSLDAVWVRNNTYGVYFDKYSYTANGSNCSKEVYKVSSCMKILHSYEELVTTFYERGFTSWFSR